MSLLTLCIKLTHDAAPLVSSDARQVSCKASRYETPGIIIAKARLLILSRALLRNAGIFEKTGEAYSRTEGITAQ